MAISRYLLLTSLSQPRLTLFFATIGLGGLAPVAKSDIRSDGPARVDGARNAGSATDIRREDSRCPETDGERGKTGGEARRAIAARCRVTRSAPVTSARPVSRIPGGRSSPSSSRSRPTNSFRRDRRRRRRSIFGRARRMPPAVPRSPT